MLDPLDEYFVHQIPQPIRRVSTSDRRAFERAWEEIFSVDGRIQLMTGVGIYPNTGVMDAYAAVSHKGRQHNIRVSQELAGNRHPLQVGPLRFEVIKPFETLRRTLSDNDFGIRFDIVWEAKYPVIETPFGQLWKDNIPTGDWWCYHQMGRCHGQITVDGETYTFGPEDLCGARDHSWGWRTGMGGSFPGEKPHLEAAANPQVPTYHSLECSDFGDRNVYWRVACGLRGLFEERGLVLYPLGSQRPPQPIKDIELSASLNPTTKEFERAEVRFKDENSQLHCIRMTPLNHILLWGAGYGEVNGWEMGKPRGKYDMAGEVWDLADPAIRQRYTRAQDYACVLEWGDKKGYAIWEVVA